jgi:hypothetical protein
MKGMRRQKIEVKGMRRNKNPAPSRYIFYHRSLLFPSRILSIDYSAIQYHELKACLLSKVVKCRHY